MIRESNIRGFLPYFASALAGELHFLLGCCWCSGELTSEEAAAKEAATRSLGNRIWAFFGGGTGAEGTGVGGEEPTSGDAVEETIPFEDPAVVQRDDHRAFPNETLLLLESIKQQALLQVLSPQQQKYVASLMHREVVGPAASVAAEGAEPALMWCSSGEFEVTQGVRHPWELNLGISLHVSRHILCLVYLGLCTSDWQIALCR